jgi:L-ribulose-5-phosphate 3-epimerase UlaE
VSDKPCNTEEIRRATLMDLIQTLDKRTADGSRPDVMTDPKVRLATAVDLFDRLREVLEKDVEMAEVYPKVLAVEVVMHEWLESISSLYAIASGLNVSGNSVSVDSTPTDGGNDADRS